MCACFSGHMTHDEISGLQFSALPPEVKLRVFALLSATERGVAARVCRDWRALMRVPTLWSDIDTTTLPVQHIRIHEIVLLIDKRSLIPDVK